MSLSDIRVGVLGKVPSQGDFIRQNASSLVGRQLHLWLEQGVELSHQARGRQLSMPACFVFTAPGGQSALVGCLAASEDRVGRNFPLAIFAEVPGRALASRFPLVPLAFQDFLLAAGALLEQAHSLGWPELQARLPALPVPSEVQFAEAEALHKRMLAEGRATLLLEAIGQQPEDLPCYAARTFLTACAAVRGQEPAKASAILDCPLPPQGQPGPWLELAHRLLRWRELPPSFFWSQGHRLLLCLGPALPSVLVFLADPERVSDRLWPLHTSVPAALHAARRALRPAQCQALQDPHASLESLLRALVQVPSPSGRGLG
jgi:type VI secretion system protein ImpM